MERPGLVHDKEWRQEQDEARKNKRWTIAGAVFCVALIAAGIVSGVVEASGEEGYFPSYTFIILTTAGLMGLVRLFVRNKAIKIVAGLIVFATGVCLLLIWNKAEKQRRQDKIEQLRTAAAEYESIRRSKQREVNP